MSSGKDAFIDAVEKLTEEIFMNMFKEMNPLNAYDKKDAEKIRKTRLYQELFDDPFLGQKDEN